MALRGTTQTWLHNPRKNGKMPTIQVPIHLIRIGDRIRELDEKHAEALAQSISEIGLLNPITVIKSRAADSFGVFVDGWRLVAGLHRIKACGLLGWEEIEARVVTLSDLETTLAECDENLLVKELSLAMRAKFTHRRKVAYEAIHPETKEHVAGGIARQHGPAAANFAAAAFTADTAAKTGLSERKVRLDAHRGAKIDEEVLDEINGTELDKSENLDALAKIDRSEQKAVVREAKAKGQTKIQRPSRAPEPVEDPELVALRKAWLKASRKNQRLFVREFEDQLRGLMNL